MQARGRETTAEYPLVQVACTGRRRPEIFTGNANKGRASISELCLSMSSRVASIAGPRLSVLFGAPQSQRDDPERQTAPP